jgi:pimeloyl-ACP methyl ester carboxylesterase
MVVLGVVRDLRGNISSMGLAVGDRRSDVNSIKLSSGNSMQYLRLNCDQEHAPTIVFVHGFPLDHSMWNGQEPLQAVANLLMPDLIGFGQSDEIDGEVSMRQMADEIADLIDLLDIPQVIYCGLSMGGYIGWEFYKNHGNRLSGLICCNTRSAADDIKTARGRRVAASQVMKTGATPVAMAMRSKLFAASTLKDKPALVQSVVETICRTKPETIAAAQLAMSRRTSFDSTINGIGVPALVIAGSDDEITPSSEMQAMAERMPDSQFHQIANSGHLSPLEQPMAFNDIVSAWTANQSS